MLTNDQMIPNRFARMARARKIMAFITTNVEAGRTVHAGTYLTVTKITKKVVAEGLVKISKSGFDVVVARGKRWESLNGCKFTAA